MEFIFTDQWHIVVKVVTVRILVVAASFYQHWKHDIYSTWIVHSSEFISRGKISTPEYKLQATMKFLRCTQFLGTVQNKIQLLPWAEVGCSNSVVFSSKLIFIGRTRRTNTRGPLDNQKARHNLHNRVTRELRLHNTSTIPTRMMYKESTEYKHLYQNGLRHIRPHYVTHFAYSSPGKDGSDCRAVDDRVILRI